MIECEKVELAIPDWILGELSLDLDQLIEDHMGHCLSCLDWFMTWMQLCELGRENLTLPDTLDWQPFHQALRTHLLQSLDLQSNQFLLLPFQANKHLGNDHAMKPDPEQELN